MSGTVYLASEDSALLRRALQPYSGLSCLEIGSGNGGNLVGLAKRFGTVVGTDLVRPEMSDWKEVGANYILADGASCLRPDSFDLVAFNPPYLAEGDSPDRAVGGGSHLEVPKRFLREALRTVNDGGAIVFLLNDEADPGEFGRLCARSGFHLERVASKRVFFEELSVFTASRQPRRKARGAEPGPLKGKGHAPPQSDFHF